MVSKFVGVDAVWTGVIDRIHSKEGPWPLSSQTRFCIPTPVRKGMEPLWEPSCSPEDCLNESPRYTSNFLETQAVLKAVFQSPSGSGASVEDRSGGDQQTRGHRVLVFSCFSLVCFRCFPWESRLHVNILESRAVQKARQFQAPTDSEESVDDQGGRDQQARGHQEWYYGFFLFQFQSVSDEFECSPV